MTVTLDPKLLTISRREIYRAMGYGDVTPEESICQQVEELLEHTIEISKPSFHYSIMSCEVGTESIEVDGVELRTARTIASLMKRSDQAAIFVATAGREFQDWLNEVTQSGDILKLFILDAIGSAFVESVGDYMESILQEDIGSLKHTNRFSPGYCDWDIVEQQKLFSLLPNGVCDIELGSTSLMYPIKSISGVIGIGESVLTKKYGCSICKRKDCYLRKI